MSDDEINLLDELDIGDEETDFGRGYARGVIEGRREAAEAIRAHVDGLRGGSGWGMNAMISDLEFAARIAQGDPDG